MERSKILPPGQRPRDSRNPDANQVAHARERLQTWLQWIDEHRGSFEKERDTAPTCAENELRYLRYSTDQAALHLDRLMELLLAGYTFLMVHEFPPRGRQCTK